MHRLALHNNDIQAEGEVEISSEELFNDMTEVNLKQTPEILKHLKPINIGESEDKMEVTILDLFNLPFEKEEEIIKFIKDRLKINIKEKEGIEQINFLFNEAIKYYRERYLRKVPAKFEKMKFSTCDSIIKFIKETKTSKKTGILNCAISKMVYVVENILSNERIGRRHLLDKKFVEEYLQKPFQILESYEDKCGNIFDKGLVVINQKIINFSIIAREKRINSIIGKEISDPKYYSVEEFKDIVGVTFYVENETDALLVMQYIDQTIFEGTAKIDNKNAITEEDVKKAGLNKGFKDKIDNFVGKNTKKKTTSDNYREIKLVGNIPLPFEEGKEASRFPVGVEIKFVIGGQDNEKGLNLQSVYDYQKRFRELSRLGLPIREIDILNYTNAFFEQIDYVLKKKNKTKENYYIELWSDLKEQGFIKDQELGKYNKENEKILALGLYKYFKSKLHEFKTPGTNKKYYMDERYLKIDNFID
ncbi:MAG: hypothetical protein PHG82_00210 [Candidatus Gracilibacteria bacterium]|nr:hypothetical protein [Candidatus Gracilibacteria bacterium]